MPFYAHPFFLILCLFLRIVHTFFLYFSLKLCYTVFRKSKKEANANEKI
nr:MAG TPA: hypothetical protein [Caudoviricetes sp.]